MVRTNEDFGRMRVTAILDNWYPFPMAVGTECVVASESTVIDPSTGRHWRTGAGGDARPTHLFEPVRLRRHETEWAMTMDAFLVEAATAIGTPILVVRADRSDRGVMERLRTIAELPLGVAERLAGTGEAVSVLGDGITAELITRAIQATAVDVEVSVHVPRQLTDG